MERFEWDTAKDEANQGKHGVSFALAYDFDWPNAVYRNDQRSDYGEARKLAYGFVGSRAFALVFVVRDGRIRIISMRPMHLKEMKKYGLQTPS